MILSIDPGTRGIGAALWCKAELLLAAYVPSPSDVGSGPRECADAARAVWAWAGRSGFGAPGDVLAVEWPQIYSRAGGKSKGDPNDLLPLAGVDSALAALFPSVEVHHFVPHAWKAGVPKPKSAAEEYIITRRVIARLSEVEQARVEWPGNKKHGWDVADALGIGLYHLGRYERKRVFARE